jgi:type I restriction enzyme S subunit
LSSHVARIGDCCTVIAGQHILAQFHNTSNQGVPYLTGPADFGSRVATASKWTDQPKVMAQAGDVLLTVKGAGVGKSNLAIDAAIGRQIMALRPRPNVLDRDYLFEFLRAHESRINALGQGATVPGIGIDDVVGIRLPLPPIFGQRQLARIMAKADAIRRKRQESLRLSNELLRSAFVDKFGDPLTNPKAWPVIKVGALLARKPQIGTITPASTDGKVPVVRVGEIGNGDLDLSACGRVTLATADLGKYQLAPGDVLLARAIGSKEHLGKASLFTRADETAVFDSHVMRLRFNAERILPLFFLHWLRSNGGRAQFLRRAGRTAVQFNVNADQMADIDLPLPPVSAQSDFVQVLGGVERTVRNLKRSLSLADDIFNSLVQRAFSGELVSELAKAAHPDL